MILYDSIFILDMFVRMGSIIWVISFCPFFGVVQFEAAL